MEQVAQHAAATRHAHQRLTAQREIVIQSIRAISYADHFVGLEHGVHHNGKLIAGDIQRHLNTLRRGLLWHSGGDRSNVARGYSDGKEKCPGKGIGWPTP